MVTHYCGHAHPPTRTRKFCTKCYVSVVGLVAHNVAFTNIASSTTAHCPLLLPLLSLLPRLCLPPSSPLLPLLPPLPLSHMLLQAQHQQACCLPATTGTRVSLLLVMCHQSQQCKFFIALFLFQLEFVWHCYYFFSFLYFQIIVLFFHVGCHRDCAKNTQQHSWKRTCCHYSNSNDNNINITTINNTSSSNNNSNTHLLCFTALVATEQIFLRK